MSIFDDSILALIARFVVDDVEKLSISDENFLKHQVLEIRNHIEDVPKEQQHKVILEWIQTHAEQYRKQWHNKTITNMLLHKRCSDCPLIDDGHKGTCDIHYHWLSLVNDYLSGIVGSEEYVNQTLQMLDEHKQELKISRIAEKLA